jgi:hypothetical protein
MGVVAQVRRVSSALTVRSKCYVPRNTYSVEGMKIECTVLPGYCVLRYSLITSKYSSIFYTEDFPNV